MTRIGTSILKEEIEGTLTVVSIYPMYCKFDLLAVDNCNQSVSNDNNSGLLTIEL